MEDIKQIRLDILNENFRQKPNVIRGFESLSKLIYNDNDKELRHLLRDHRLEPIEINEEVIFRDNVDFLIGYYSILGAAIIARYIPSRLNKRSSEEISFILSSSPVKSFYRIYYQLYLPQILYEHLEADEYDYIYNYTKEIDSEDRMALIFENCLLLLRNRIEDSDIDQFLWLLDDGYTYDNVYKDHISIRLLWETLKNPEIFRVVYLDKALSSSVFRKALVGFTKFISYLDEYAELLKSCNNNEMLKSALWHMESYWFDHISNQLGDVLKEGINNMSNLITSGYYERMDKDVDEEDINEWRVESQRQVEKSLDDINFLFNRELGRPIINLLNRYKDDQLKKYKLGQLVDLSQGLAMLKLIIYSFNIANCLF